MTPSALGQLDDVIHGQFPAAAGALIRAVNLLVFVGPAEGGPLLKPPRVAGCCLSFTGPHVRQDWNYLSMLLFDSLKTCVIKTIYTSGLTRNGNVQTDRGHARWSPVQPFPLR